jgi:PST family polysaccharide transporter
MANAQNIHLADNESSGDLSRQALRGGAASVMSRLINGGIQMTSAIVLARLLTPTDYGLVAMVNVLTSFAPLLIDFGLGDAMTQKARITHQQVSCLFWMSSGIGLVLTILMAGCSPLIARMYHEPQLQGIAIMSSVTFVLLGMSGQHLALLRRKLQFAKVARIEVGSNLTAVALAISLAAVGYGYWGLVIRPIAAAACMLAGAWIYCRWRPGLPVFDDEVKKLVRFGMHVVGFTMTYTAGKSSDRFALGLCYPAREVGLYQNALNLYENSIFAVIAPMHNVGSAALSKLQSVPQILKQKYLAALSSLAFYIMPAAAMLSVLSVDLVVVLLGEKWRVAGSLLGILALRGMFHVIDGSQGWLHLSTGRPDRWMKWGIVSTIVQVTAVVAGLPYGARGVAIGFVVSGCALAFPAIMYAGRPVRLTLGEVLKATGRQLTGALIVTGAGWWLRTGMLQTVSSLSRIIILGAFCAVAYVLVVVILFRLDEPVKVGWRLVREHLPGRLAMKPRTMAEGGG